MMYKAKQHKLITADLKTDYITFGTGSKTLVMIQGLNTNGINGAAIPFAYMYRIFAKDYNVYLFDRRQDVREGITVRDMANDTAMAMDALNISKADIIGVSQGGMVAQYLAIDRPDLVNKMILAVTLSRNNDTVSSVIQNWITLTEQNNIKQLVYDMATKMYSDNYIKKYKPFLPLLTLMQKPKDARRFIILAKACLTCETYDLLDLIECPVLVIGARKDNVVTGEASEEMARRLNCELKMYDDLGHAAYEEARDFNSIMLNFLKKEQC